MDDLGEEQFVVEEVTALVKECIDTVLGGSSFEQSKVEAWAAAVGEGVLSALTKLQKPFKYVITCSLAQKNGAGFVSSSSCYWDKQTDASAAVRWENMTICCFVSVFGMAV